MKLNLSKSFFVMFMIVGMIMCLCSNNWLFIWCGLELSLISFLPLMSSKLVISSESSMKYFLVQSISSSILIIGLMSMVMKIFVHYDFIICTSLLIKMGVAPFHLWLLSVVEGLELVSMIFMFTLSKISPLVILTFMNLSTTLIISITLMVGSISGLNQSSTRKIIAYSSIFNMGLILAVICNNFTWIFYLSVYSILIIVMMVIFFNKKMFYVNQLIMSENSSLSNLMLWVTLLSMGGMPPLLGFSIKLIVIEFMINSNLIFNLILIILFSLLVMFFYLRMTYLSVMFFSLTPKWTIMGINKISLIFMLMNLISLPLILSFKIFS